MPSPYRTLMASRVKPARLFLALSLAFTTGVSSVVVANPVTAQELASAADYVPANVVMYAEFELDQESDQVVLATALVERTNLSSLLASDDAESVEEAFDTLGLVFDGEAAVFVTELPVDEFLSTTEMALEATDIGSDPVEAVTEEIPEGWAVVIHPSNAEEAFGFYESLVFGDEDASITDSAYGGFDILTNEPVDGMGTPLSMALVDEVIVVASNPDDIHPVIDTVNGDLEVLSESDAYSEVRGAFADELLSFTYLNSPLMEEQLVASGGEDALQAIESQGTSLDFLQGVAVWATEDGFRIDTVSLPVDPASIAEPTIYENTFAAHSPAGALTFAGGTNLGTNPGVEAAALVIAQGVIADKAGVDMMATPMLDPEASAQEIFAEAESTIGFNIQTDVLDALEGEWSATATIGDIMVESPEFSGLFLSEVTDEESINAVLSSLTEKIESESAETGEDVTISSSSVDGSEVTIISIDDTDVPLTMEYGVIDGKLAISVNQPLDIALNTQAETLADNDMFVQTFEALPQENLTSVSYLDVSQLVPLVEGWMTLSSSSGSSEDNDPECGTFASQMEAQAAYDEDTFERWNLDLDFDGEACEDFFAAETAASPEAAASMEIGLLSMGSVTYNDGNTIGSSTIILIEG